MKYPKIKCPESKKQLFCKMDQTAKWIAKNKKRVSRVRHERYMRTGQ